MSGCPDKEMALHAYLDGELDALGVAAFEAHLAECVGCREKLAEAEAVRAALRGAGVPAPAALRARIEAMAGGQDVAPVRRSRISWGSFAGGGGIGAIAASIALLVALPQISEPGLADQLVAGHVRSLQAGHLVDVATSNRHVVKPWFNGRIDFAPPVPDLAARGFPLVGGRLDVVEGRTVAALVYKRNLHSINLFVRPAAGLGMGGAASMKRDSYSLVRWRAGGLEYWAVSDIEPGDLAAFEREFRAAAEGVAVSTFIFPSRREKWTAEGWGGKLSAS